MNEDRDFGWHPRWNLETAVEKVVEWSKVWSQGKDVRPIMDKQLNEFLEIRNNEVE